MWKSHEHPTLWHVCLEGKGSSTWRLAVVTKGSAPSQLTGLPWLLCAGGSPWSCGISRGLHGAGSGSLCLFRPLIREESVQLPLGLAQKLLSARRWKTTGEFRPLGKAKSATETAELPLRIRGIGRGDLSW